jgi:serine/threonine-protein kinase
MIDGDGVPHLMDFGLARRDMGEITMTMEGQVLGTPAYMSPEQAQGESHTADRRSDVYSIGVMLFQLLTGELPFRGNSRMQIHQVINDEAPSPRKFNGSVPKDLETITLRCLEKDPQRRFQSAEELADELQRHLDGEPIQSRPISAASRAWRWCRRKPLVAGLSAAIASLVALVAIAGPLVAVKQASLRRTAERNEDLALAAQRTAEEARREADARFLKSRETVDTWLTGYSEALQNIPVHGVQAVRTRMLELAAREYEAFAGEKSDDATLRLEQGRTLIRLGSIYRLLGRHEEALEKFAAAQSVLTGLETDEQISCEARAALAMSRGIVALLHADRGDAKQADAEFTAAIEELESGYKQTPSAPEFLLPLVTLWTNRGGVLAKAGSYEVAEKAFVKAVVAGETLVAALPNELRHQAALAAARIGVGQVQLMQGDAAKATENLEIAIKLLTGAHAEQREAAQYLELVVSANLNLAAARRRLGDVAGERNAYAAAIDAAKQLSASQPDAPAFRMDLAMTQIDLAQSMLEQYEPAPAEPMLREATLSLAAIAKEYPAVAAYHETLGISLDNLAHALMALGHYAEALACADQSTREFQELAGAWPDVAAYQERWAIAESTAGQILHLDGKGKDALKRFASAEALFEKILGVEPPTADRWQNAAILSARFGEALYAADPQAAAQAFERAAQRWDATLAASPDPQFASGAAWFFVTCLTESLRDAERACDLAAKAFGVASANARYRLTLAVAQAMAGRSADSLATADAEQVKDLAIAPAFDLARALAAHAAGRPEDAQAHWKTAADWAMKSLPGAWDIVVLRRVTADRLGIEQEKAPAADATPAK